MKAPKFTEQQISCLRFGKPCTPQERRDCQLCIEKILAMTDEECRLEGIAEFGSEEAWLKAMQDLKAKMLKAVGLPEQEGT